MNKMMEKKMKTYIHFGTNHFDKSFLNQLLKDFRQNPMVDFGEVLLMENIHEKNGISTMIIMMCLKTLQNYILR